MHKLRYTLFHIDFRLQADIFDFSLTLTSSGTNIRPTMLFDAIYIRIPLKFRLYSICDVRSHCFRFPPFWFPVELRSNCAKCNVTISSARWLRHPQKQTQQRWICFQRRYALWFNGHHVYHIFTKKSSIPPSLTNNANINSCYLPFELKTCYI